MLGTSSGKVRELSTISPLKKTDKGARRGKRREGVWEVIGKGGGLRGMTSSKLLTVKNK